MCSGSIEFGKTGEKIAAGFLKTRGYKILECNYKNKFGEIDIIARQGRVICFLEVKARHSLELGRPEESVSISKQKKICRVALEYLKNRQLLGQPARFDVVGLLYRKDLPDITLITDAFELGGEFTV